MKSQNTKDVLQLKILESGEIEKVEFFLKNKDRETLINFFHEVNELLETGFLNFTSNLTVNFDFVKNKGKFEGILPPKNVINSFLHRFRPFWLDESELYYYKILKILHQTLPNNFVRLLLNEQKDILSGKSEQKYLIITSNGENINTNHMLNIWLNAYQYHRDDGKKKKLEELHRIFPLEFSEQIFVMMLQEKAYALRSLALFSGVLLGKVNDLRIDP